MSVSQKELVHKGLALVTAFLIAVAPAGLVAAQDTGQNETSGDTTVSDTTASQQQTETSEPVEPGMNQPTGSDAPTYTYNADTGLWENDYFTWDPVTKKTTPKTSNGYSYNPSTGHWDTVDWQYNPGTGTYTSNGSTYEPGGDPTYSITNTGPGSDNTIQNFDPSCNCSNPGQYSIDQTGPYSNNEITNDNDSTSIFDGYFDANISTTIGSYAQTGDASVSYNTNGGNATSGDADALLNVINMLQSAWGVNGNDFSTFSATIDGDHTGDLVIAPPTTNPDIHVGPPQDTVVMDVDVDAIIDNDINLDVTSGNASVDHNTTGGDATTGDSTAIANIINMIGTMISAQQSFIGVINVTGDLTGDILVADDGLTNLTPNGNAAYGGPSYTLDIDDNQTINNNVTAEAASGSAQVNSNTNGGSATTGDAETSIALFNLTGKQVIAENSVLVFVNVMGEWVGLIVDGAEGQNSAILASGVEHVSTSPESAVIGNTGPDSTNTILSEDNSEDSVYDIDTNAVINNDINITSQTGDANVSNNTNGGSATSGDALAVANILNITQSNFSLGGWMGIVFVNVLGDWFGSFGEDTAYGDPVLPSPDDYQPAATPINKKHKSSKFGNDDSGDTPHTNSGNSNFIVSTVSRIFEGGGSNSTPKDESRQGNERRREASFISHEDQQGQPVGNNVNLMLTASATAIVLGALLLAAQRAFGSDTKQD